ncbi:MAG TPA: glycosyltransferase [Longimicrobiales bacterium]|nr:glycosyltransferase [Longimicrobiales bacterium]
MESGTEHRLSLTVAVCTWNRCALLRRALEQMTRLVVPPEVEWEVLVVNNRSTDGTDEVIAEFADRLPIRRAWEPEPGLANARNRAVAEARGEYILWTDDDCLVDPDWLAAYARAFRRWPDAAIFGGPIEPLFEGEPPAWIPRVLDRIGPVFGLQTLGEEPVELTPDTVSAGPYGGNMAMRRDVLQCYRFDPGLGVRHGEYRIGEETELMRAMLAAGVKGWWTPEPRVRHWVPRKNQTPAYVRRWMVGHGHYIVRSPAEGRRHRRFPPYRLRIRIVRYEVQYRIRRLIAPPEIWIRDLVRASRARGQLLEQAAMEEHE